MRRATHTQGAYGQLLIFSVSIFFLAFLIYAGLAFGYTPYLESSAADLDEQIRQFGNEIPQEEQERITTFYSALVSLRTLLAERSSTSPIFTFLEEKTGPSVYFTRASVNVPRREIALSGVAPNADEIAAQILLFEEDPRVETVNFRDASVSGGPEWQFSVTLIATPELLKGNLP